MIVILGSIEDTLVQEVIPILEGRGQPIAIVSPAEMVFDYPFTCFLGGHQEPQMSQLTLGSALMPFSSVSSIWWRGQFPLSPTGSENWSSEDLQYLLQEGAAIVWGILQKMNCPIMNQPTPGGRSQFFFADDCWKRVFEKQRVSLVPMCLVTSSSLAQEWAQECSGMIRKIPISPSGSEGLRIIDDPPQGWDWDFAKMPLCLQAIPEGQWFHVITIGSEVRGGPINPQDGYGSFMTGVEPQGCPSQLFENSVVFGRAFQMEFSESLWIDGHAGQWYCVDWNTVPQVEHWGESMQKEVSKVLAQWLSDPH